MDSMNKIKTIFQILILVCASFSYFVFNSENVFAEDTVCCEQTVNNGYCEYVTESQCKASAKKAPTSCDKTSYCQPGCFIDTFGEGYCYSNYPRAKAEMNKGKFDANPNCDQVSDCKKGCCIIGTQAAYVTEERCKVETGNFKDLSVDFRPAASEEDCLRIAHTADKGACVSEAGSCVYTTNAECNVARQEINITENNKSVQVHTGFYKNKYCSDLSLCTPGKQSNRKGCISTSDDVYYIDSCGNPEGVAEDCNYASGTMCDFNEGNYICKSLDCGTVQDMLGSQFKIDENYKLVSADKIKHGESWCLYDDIGSNAQGGLQATNSLTSVGENLRDLGSVSRDAVGSRHYRAICINGKQFVEPCEDYRKEWCLQGTVAGDGTALQKGVSYSEARCIDNRWQSCIDECNTAKPGMSSSAWNDAQKKDFGCCTDVSKRDCAWVGGKCTPRVKPGTKFWENEGSNNCGKASLSCSFTITCDGWDRLFTWGSCNPNWFSKFFSGAGDSLLGWKLDSSGGWKPVDKSQADMCLSNDFIQAANNLCRSYGDCGASYNLAGEITYDGFLSPSSLGGEFSNIVGDRLKKAQLNSSSENIPNWEKGNKILNFKLKGETGGISNHWGWSQWTGFSFVSAQIIIGSLNAVFETAKWGTFWTSQFGSTFSQGLFSGFYGTATKSGADLIILKANFEAAQKATEAAAKEAAEAAAKKAAEAKRVYELAQGKTVNTIFNVISAYMWVKLGYDIFNTVASKSQMLTVQTTCTNWQAPKIKDDCEKCNQEYNGYTDQKTGKPLTENAFKSCSEYRCKSFGASCELINKGTNNETCVSLNQYDVNSPMIQPWNEGFDKEYQNSIEILNNGFKIKKSIPIYERVLIALKTDEPSQCKMSFNHTKDYNSMESIYFGGTSYAYYHIQQIFYPSSKNYTKEGLTLQSGGDYSLYVRCSDAVGNSNVAEYAVQFKIGNEPDLTAPSIVGSSLPNETYVTAGQNDTSVVLFVNEPARCRWSNTPLAFVDMEKSRECATGSVPNSLSSYYECLFDGDKKITNIGGGIKDIKYIYFKCQDIPSPADKNAKANTNKDSYVITFKGSQKLNITNVLPSGDLFLDLSKENITLEIDTFGGVNGNGESTCKYTKQESLKNSINSMDDVLESYGSVHKKILTGLSTGEHKFYVGCSDIAGNVVYNQTSFKILTDTTAPGIVKYYWSEEIQGHLVFITSELAECQYSKDNSNFKYGEGSLTMKDGYRHDTAEESSVYYIVCSDSFDNKNLQPYVFRKI
jgi:hypothetical protein